jgi:hypothetical protein
MQNTAGRAKITVSADGAGSVSQAGALLLTQTLRLAGLDRGLSAGLAWWRPDRAVHDPGKIIADLAVMLALGGDCLADIAVLRAEPALFGPVASDPVVSRLIGQLAGEAPRALKAIRSARAAARQRAWALAGDAAPGADGTLVTIDVDATIVTACSVLAYSVGFTITGDIQDAILKIPARAWAPAYDAEGLMRPGAWVAELTGLLDLSAWPKGMRVIVRKERPHPGAQLRFTDLGGHRFTCFATDAKAGQLAELELRHRRRARCEDRIRCAKDTGLRNLPLHGYAQNQIWCEITMLACELLAWMQMLALDGPARRWEPKKLRLRLFACAGRIIRGGRRLRLRLAKTWPWASQIAAASTRIQALAPG